MNTLRSAASPLLNPLGKPARLPSGVHPETSRRLQKADVASRKSRFEAERLLWEARAEDPACLPVYLALYNFYARGFRLHDAVRVSHLAIAEAATQGRFSADWEKLNVGSDRSSHIDLYASEAGLFFLFALRCLALATLRQKKFEDAKSIIAHLTRLDWENRFGSLSADSTTEFSVATIPEHEHD